MCSEENRLKDRGEEGRVKSTKKRKVKEERLKRRGEWTGYES